jgi:hypothetical protein
MLDNKGITLLLLLVFFVVTKQVHSQSNSLTIGSGVNPVQVIFKNKDSISVEMIQDKVNIAIASTKGLRLEINHFLKNQLNCGKLVYGKFFQLVLFQNSKKFESKPNDYKNSIGIVCTDKNAYKLYVKGLLYNGQESIKIRAQLNVKIE